MSFLSLFIIHIQTFLPGYYLDNGTHNDETTLPIDRLDGPPMFKCAILHDITMASAKQLMIPLNDLLWDPM